MSTTSSYGRLRLEAPRELLQITQGEDPTDQTLEVINPPTWIRYLVGRQEQAENDLRHLQDVCEGTLDQTDQRIRNIERSYETLQKAT